MSAVKNTRDISTANTTVTSGISISRENSKKEAPAEENFPKARGLVSKKSVK